jgi:4'-phosphopantetheinyl transferase EntD
MTALGGAQLDASGAAQLFGAACVLEQGAPELVDGQLFPEEVTYLAQSVPKRRAEFGMARVCARRALARLGVAPVALVPEQDRAPRWPAGIVGSITHTQSYCAAVVARRSELQSVGIDAEQDRLLGEEIMHMVCTKEEQAVVTARDAVVYFSAKEAFYKCQYPLTKQFLDFQDVTLALDWSRGTFRARVHRPLSIAAALSKIEGRFVRERGLVICGMSLPALGAS